MDTLTTPTCPQCLTYIQQRALPKAWVYPNGHILRPATSKPNQDMPTTACGIPVKGMGRANVQNIPQPIQPTPPSAMLQLSADEIAHLTAQGGRCHKCQHLGAFHSTHCCSICLVGDCNCTLD